MGIIGFGRIGQALTVRLTSLGAFVIVCARNEAQMRRAHEIGAHPLPLERIAQACAQADVIFNTVPELLLTRPVLEQLRPGTLVVDLASKPGGVDWEAARQLNVKAVHALALPGQLTPVSGAMAIRNAVYELCKEERYAR